MQELFFLKDLVATEMLAKLIARAIVPDFVVTLNGELGAGKTTLVRSVLYALGVSGSIKSPTFTIVEPYKVEHLGKHLDVYHFDLYRFNDPSEWFYSGFDEYFVHNSICFIEWADKAIELIPTIDWQINIKTVEDVMEDDHDTKIGLNINNMDSRLRGNDSVSEDDSVAECSRIIEIETKSDKGEECLIRLMKHAAKFCS